MLGAIFRFLSHIWKSGTEISIRVPIEWTGYNKLDKQIGGFKPTWVILHHSYSVDGQTRNWDAIRRYHMSFRYQGEIITESQWAALLAEGKTSGLEKPWSDIGYNLGIENVNGKLTVLPGRPIGAPGAHAVGFNTRSVGICLIGNYDLDPPSEDRLALLASLCRQLQLEFAIPRDQVIGHRETYPKLNPPEPVQKTCPGSQFDLTAFRKRLRD